MAITTEQIHAAASAIDATGQKPTLTAIRSRLGSGSYSTISAALSTWVKDSDDDQEYSPLPDAAQVAWDNAAGALWLAAKKMAADDYAQRDENAKQHILQMQVERDEAIKLADDLVAKVEQAAADELLWKMRIDEEAKRVLDVVAQRDRAQAFLAMAEALSAERLKSIEALTAKAVVLKQPIKKA